MTAPVTSVGPPATLPATYDPSQAAVNASGTGKPTEMFDSQMFLQLLVAQLKYQDPTDPVDTSNFMNQTAMLSQVQTMNSMSSTLSDLVAAQQTSSATSMIGKAISFVDPSGNQTSGIVDAVTLHAGQVMLQVGSLAVPLAGVLAVANPVPVTGGTGSDTGAVDGLGTTDGTGATSGTDSASGTTGSGATSAAPDTASGDPAPGSDTTTSTDSTSV